MGENLSGLFADPEFSNTDLAGANSPENLFSIFESLESASELPSTSFKEMDFSSKPDHKTQQAPQKSTSSTARQESETDVEVSPAYKRLKCSTLTSSSEVAPDGQEPTSHIMVERNRRRQMNDHLTVLRSMMPCFYIKKGDQASIVGGVVNFIKELQQVLHSLEAKKQRKVFNEVLSPRPISSPRIAPLGPIPPPLSPRISIPISPRTPQPSSPYNPAIQHHHPKPTMSILGEVPSFESVKELAANSKSLVANVEVKFSGPNVLVRTTSQRIPGQALKIIAALQGLSLEILHVSISTIDKTMLNSFTIKIGIECKLSAEELANEIQQTFC